MIRAIKVRSCERTNYLSRIPSILDWRRASHQVDKARDLKNRKVLGLGELVIATGADGIAKRRNGNIDFLTSEAGEGIGTKLIITSIE